MRRTVVSWWVGVVVYTPQVIARDAVITKPRAEQDRSRTGPRERGQGRCHVAQVAAVAEESVGPVGCDQASAGLSVTSHEPTIP